ncbi:MAG: NADH-quinone oxidoreductase subunit C, partial [Anaerolineales bacterium]|nr:NADH-quinone oxidoreductase subunit C [Anaerolineales bacterium]
MKTAEALSKARQLVEEWEFKTITDRPEPNRLDVALTTVDDLIPIVVGLRVIRLGYLSAITGLDLGVEEGELEILYHFCTGAAVITLRVRVPRQDASVPTLTEIIPSAEAFERELSEMFGVEVVGLRNNMRLYLPDDLPEDIFPLRKDISDL